MTMATVKLLQPTNMAALPSTLAGNIPYWSFSEVGMFNSGSWCAALGNFGSSEIFPAGTISQVFIDDGDPGVAPNLEISGLSFFMSTGYWLDVFDNEGNIVQFVT